MINNNEVSERLETAIKCRIGLNKELHIKGRNLIYIIRLIEQNIRLENSIDEDLKKLYEDNIDDINDELDWSINY